MAYPQQNQDWDKINYEKDRRIAYFNSLNAAIQVIASLKWEPMVEEALIKWRDFFLKEWENWYQKEFPHLFKHEPEPLEAMKQFGSYRCEECDKFHEYIDVDKKGECPNK